MTDVSPLRPVDPNTLLGYENEASAPWIMRKLVGSMTGRIVMSTFESLRAAGTSVICISAFTTKIIKWLKPKYGIFVQGGTAAIIAPAMGPAVDTVVGAVGDSIAVEIGLVVGYDMTIKLGNDLLFDKVIKGAIPVHSTLLETTAVKNLLITLKYKHTRVDAALGYFRSSAHEGDPAADLFSSITDYLSIEKGWWNPTLFASGRRPCIPRSMKPDVVFCHGPFLQGDYRVAETLLQQSASVLSFSDAVPGFELPPPSVSIASTAIHSATHSVNNLLKTSQNTVKDWVKSSSRTSSPQVPAVSLPEVAQEKNDSSTLAVPDEAGSSAVLIHEPAVAPPRRMVILLVGISPHRKLWTTSARPAESVINYHLLNGCPAIVVPVKMGCPLIAWDTLTLEALHKVGTVQGAKFDGILKVLFEYVSLCADWERFVISEQLEIAKGEKRSKEEVAKELVKDALTLLVAAAIRSKDSKEVKKHVDLDRAGIVMLRMP